MKGRLLWKVLLIVGLAPFVAPLGIFCILSARNPGLSPAELVNFILIYSIFYWPTYAVGIALIVLSMIIKLRHDS